MSIVLFAGTIALLSSLPMAYRQPYGLAVVLCEAPPLLATLSPKDWAALSSCNN